MKQKRNAGELNLEKFFQIIKNNKGLILSLMLVTTLSMFVKLYFTPSIYQSSSILEIKSKFKGTTPNDFLLNAFSFSSVGKIEKEVEVLQTFSVNKKALEKVPLDVNYYKTEAYKNIEIYENTPFTINNIEIYNRELIGKELTIIPKEKGFTLHYPSSLKERFFSFIDDKNGLDNKVFMYDKEIKNQDFSLVVHKNFDFIKPIKIKFNGNYRLVFDKIVKRKLKISQMISDTPLIKISYEDNIPKRATAYIDELIKSFINSSIKDKNEQNNRVLLFINKQLNNIRNTLKTSEKRLEVYKIKNDIIEPSTQAKKYIEKLSTLEIELSENLLKQKLVNNLSSFIKNNNNNLDAIAPSLMELHDKTTLDLIVSYQKLEIKMSNLKTELTDKHPKIITVKKQMYYIRQKIISNIKNLKSLIRQKHQSLKQEKRSYEAKIKTLPKEEKNLVNINRDYKVSATMYDYLLKKKTESELFVISTFSDYKVIDKAHAIVEPIKPKRALLMVISPLIGLFLGIVLAVMLKSLDNKISSKKELEELTDLPLLGIIPLHKNKNARLEVYNDLNSEFTESYRSLRANLPTKKEDGTANIILVTSTVESEGKTTLISNLASVFQMVGYKSIILNLDLRKPTLHGYFDLDNEKGMSTYLSGHDSIQDIVFSTKYPKLHVITSGPIPKNPSELILSHRFNTLLDMLKTHYDYIFIDSAPVGLVSDTIHLMKFTDRNIIIFKENHAEASFVDAIHAILKKSNINNVGIVLNQSTSRNKLYGYGYGYGV